MDQIGEFINDISEIVDEVGNNIVRANGPVNVLANELYNFDGLRHVYTEIISRNTW